MQRAEDAGVRRLSKVNCPKLVLDILISGTVFFMPTITEVFYGKKKSNMLQEAR